MLDGSWLMRHGWWPPQTFRHYGIMTIWHYGIEHCELWNTAFWHSDIIALLTLWHYDIMGLLCHQIIDMMALWYYGFWASWHTCNGIIVYDHGIAHYEHYSTIVPLEHHGTMVVAIFDPVHHCRLSTLSYQNSSSQSRIEPTPNNLCH